MTQDGGEVETDLPLEPEPAYCSNEYTEPFDFSLEAKHDAPFSFDGGRDFDCRVLEFKVQDDKAALELDCTDVYPLELIVRWDAAALGVPNGISTSERLIVDFWLSGAWGKRLPRIAVRLPGGELAFSMLNTVGQPSFDFGTTTVQLGESDCQPLASSCFDRKFVGELHVTPPSGQEVVVQQFEDVRAGGLRITTRRLELADTEGVYECDGDSDTVVHYAIVAESR